MIRASVIADSVSPHGKRLTTIQYRCHRWILSEVNTHGLLVKNARSSRAVPTLRLIDEVRTDPAMPVHWGRNQPGMGTSETLSPEQIEIERAAWIEDANRAADRAEERYRRGGAKQWVNRPLEPFMWVDGLMTATAWKNFFALRIHPSAQPEFHALALAIRDAMEASTPRQLAVSEWHLPYVTATERAEHDIEILKKLSARRNARVSYKPFDGQGDVATEVSRTDEMLASRPIHASPFGHVAQADRQFADGSWSMPEYHGPFDGWAQWRQMIHGHCVKD